MVGQSRSTPSIFFFDELHPQIVQTKEPSEVPKHNIHIFDPTYFSMVPGDTLIKGMISGKGMFQRQIWEMH